MSISTPLPSPCKQQSQMLKQINNTYPSAATLPGPAKSLKPLPTYRRDVSTPNYVALPPRPRGSAWQAMKRDRISIIGDSLGFEGKPGLHARIIANLCKGLETPFLFGTMSTPAGLLSSFDDPEMFYHAYAVSRKLTDSDMQVIFTCFLQHDLTEFNRSGDPHNVVANVLERIVSETKLCSEGNTW